MNNAAFVLHFVIKHRNQIATECRRNNLTHLLSSAPAEIRTINYTDKAFSLLILHKIKLNDETADAESSLHCSACILETSVKYVFTLKP
jgi:hypothetical protein